MGNIYPKKEADDSKEFKEPQMASEKLDIPSDTRENKEKEEPKEENKEENIEENKEEEKHEEDNEENIEEENKGENNIEENVEQNKEENAEENIEEDHEENQEEEKHEEDHEENNQEAEAVIKVEEGDNHNVEQNEEEQEEQMNEENQNDEIKTPEKGKVYNFTKNGQLFQVDDRGQLYKVVIESQELNQNQRIIPIQKDNEEISESYEVNQDQNSNNMNNIVYHDIAFRSNKKINSELDNNQNRNKIIIAKTSYKNKEPKDSIPKMHIVSKNKYKNTNIKINAEYVDIPRNQYGANVNKEITMVLGNGMDTGEYKFIGQKTLVKENIVPNGNLVVNQEEISEELNKRKNKKKEKKIKYEIVDKFYALANMNNKVIKKVEKTESKAGSKNYFYATLNTSNYNINNNNINTNFNNNINTNSNLIQSSSFRGMNTQGNFTQFGSMQMNNMNMMNNFNNMNMMNNMNNFNNMNSMNLYMNNMNITMPLDNYSRYFLSQINKIRTEPQSFIGVIEDSKSNIIKDRLGRIIYNGKIKVALNSGEKAFDDAIQFLKELNPVEPLIYNQMLTANVPLTEEEIMDKNDLNKKVEMMIQMGVNIRSFWRDVIKDPEISFLLMIIDDNGIKSGMRRKDILSPYMKHIGISSTEIKNNFVCYVTLA